MLNQQVTDFEKALKQMSEISPKLRGDSGLVATAIRGWFLDTLEQEDLELFQLAQFILSPIGNSAEWWLMRKKWSTAAIAASIKEFLA